MRSTTVAALAAALCLAASTCAAAPAGSLEEKVLEAGEICDDVKQYSGYYHLNTHDAHYFYWAFESRTPSNVTIMWLTGGPGCSSSVALFGENGPCKVSADATQTTKNPYSWNTNANLVYVDQPAGTGFSYGSGMDHNESQVSADLYDFVQQFMKAHPQFADDRYFLVGESYAGHYVPATARAIFDGNQNLGPGDIKINLAGFGIGNGLVDPETQYGYYADMAISSNDHEPAVSNTTYKIMKAATPSCVKSIAACQNSSVACVLATDVCNAALLLPYQFTGMNPYDMREKCKVPPLCYNFSNVAAYLARADVRQTLGVAPLSALL